MKTILPTLALALALPAAAQSLESVAPEPAGSGPDAAPAHDESRSAEMISTPSRYAGIDIDAYIQTLLSSFDMRQRDRDPFGRHQDPNFTPPAPVIAKTRVEKYKPEPITPFSDIVEAIPINAIMPSRGEFLVGGRSYGVGSRLKLNTGKSEPLTVHVVGIDSNRVMFRHSVTNETADHVLKILPGGMIRGGGEARPEGVVPANAPDTIDVPVGGPNSLSSRR